MSNIRFKNVSDYNDLATRNTYNILLKESRVKADKFLALQAELSRDNSRTPMQWDSSVNAGFTTGKPWLPVNPNRTIVNVASEEKDPNSILHFVRQMIKLRNDHKAVLVYGKYELLDKTNPAVYAYTREAGDTIVLVLLNFTKNGGAFDLGKLQLDVEWINNLQPLSISGNKINLQPYQACIVKLK
jgi:glycosidase